MLRVTLAQLFVTPGVSSVGTLCSERQVSVLRLLPTAAPPSWQPVPSRVLTHARSSHAITDGLAHPALHERYVAPASRHFGGSHHTLQDKFPEASAAAFCRLDSGKRILSQRAPGDSEASLGSRAEGHGRLGSWHIMPRPREERTVSALSSQSTPDSTNGVNENLFPAFVVPLYKRWRSSAAEFLVTLTSGAGSSSQVLTNEPSQSTPPFSSTSHLWM